jgi:NAD(P)-dependent dehydrogenase (short-subunit alcohol dehydrogenase family)
MSVFRKGSTALITGGASGIGLEVAILCLKHGVRVAIVDNNDKTLAFAESYLLSEPKDDVSFFQADVSKEEDWQSLAKKVRERWGLGPEEGPDFLMLNAGVGARGTWGDGEYFRKVSDHFCYFLSWRRWRMAETCPGDHDRV